MAIIQSGVSGSTLMTVDPTYAAARVTMRPPEQLGTYFVGAPNGGGTPAVLTNLSAGASIFSMRFIAGSAGQAQIVIVNRITMSVAMTGAFTAATQLAYGAYVARSFTGSDSGGTQIVVSGNNQKARTSMPTSQIATSGDMRISGTGALTVGTRTLDSLPFASTNMFVGTTAITTGMLQPVQITLYEYVPGDTPIILASNEGLVINSLIAMGAASSLGLVINVEWTESASSSSTAF